MCLGFPAQKASRNPEEQRQQSETLVVFSMPTEGKRLREWK